MKFLMSLFVVLYFAGCTTLSQDIATLNSHYEIADFDKALQFSIEKRGEENNPSKLIWNLNAASVYRVIRDYQNSNKYFDAAEDNLRDFRRKNGLSTVGNELMGALLNDGARAYEAEEFEKIMTNTYKAINFAVDGDFDNARVEFNRALSRQDEAKVLFRKEIEAVKRTMAKESKRIVEDNRSAQPRKRVDGTVVQPRTVRKDFSIKSVVENESFDSIIQKTYSNLDSFSSNKDFVNPFSMYFSSLFFWLDNDSSKALDLMKEVYAMTKKNSFVKQDLIALRRGIKPTNKLWVIIENGLGPVKEEVRVDVPLFIFTDRVDYSAMALPKFKKRPTGIKHFELNIDGSTKKTEAIASLDAIAFAEFKKDIKLTIFREITRVIWKTYTQKLLKDENELAGLAMAIFQGVSTGADTRSWTTLPKDFHLVSSTIPSTRMVRVGVAGLYKDIQIPDCNNAILYIKYINGNSGLIYDFITFN